jgi:excisionase family DNA binding protein
MSRLQNLASHDKPFVTTDDLARYWCVSRRHIHKQIEEGNLPAIRLGPRSVRIATQDAIEFERRSRFTPRSDSEDQRDSGDRRGEKTRTEDGTDRGQQRR